MFRCELCDEYLNFFRGGCLCENCYDIRTITKCYDSSTILNCLKEHFTVESKFSPKEEKNGYCFSMVKLLRILRT